jgi:methionyl-tRNA formyltransferase
MDEGTDSGDIISKAPVKIGLDETATTLYNKIMDVAQKRLRKFVPLMSQGKLTPRPQDHTKATYWRKRSKNDGCIDFRMNAEAVHNLVRALTKPYPGAHAVYQQQEIKIWEAQPEICPATHHEPGKVLEVTQSTMLVKCGYDAIRLVKHEFEIPLKAGEYIL